MKTKDYEETLNKTRERMYAPIAIKGYFECPFCHSRAGYKNTSRVSGGGWVVVVLLLLFCFPLFWIIETHQYCKTCRVRMSIIRRKRNHRSE